MEKKRDKYPTSIRLTSDLRQRIDQELLKRKYGNCPITFEGAVHEALEAWVSEETKAARQSPSEELTHFKESNGKWHLLLEEVLNHGGADVIDAIRSNLVVSERYVRMRPESKKGKVG